jgi:hypothetical protein
MNKTWRLRDDPSNYDDEGRYIDGPPSKVGPQRPMEEPEPTGHTPGPWESVPPKGSLSHAHIKSATKPIAFVCWNQSNDEADANARLIAAAPELLAAAKHYYKCHGNCGSPREQDAADRLRAAIAKAEGKQ